MKILKLHRKMVIITYVKYMHNFQKPSFIFSHLSFFDKSGYLTRSSIFKSYSSDFVYRKCGFDMNGGNGLKLVIQAVIYHNAMSHKYIIMCVILIDTILL